MADHPDPFVPSGRLFRNLTASIRRTVVYHNNLPVPIGLTANTLNRFFYIFFHAVSGHDDTKIRILLFRHLCNFSFRQVPDQFLDCPVGSRPIKLFLGNFSRLFSHALPSRLIFVQADDCVRKNIGVLRHNINAESFPFHLTPEFRTHTGINHRFSCRQIIPDFRNNALGRSSDKGIHQNIRLFQIRRHQFIGRVADKFRIADSPFRNQPF